MLVPIRKLQFRNKLYIIFIIILLMIVSNLIIFYVYQSKENDVLTKQNVKLSNQYDSLKIVNDSLYAELFPVEVELNRYQVAFKLFLLQNPQAAKQFEDIISMETE